MDPDLQYVDEPGDAVPRAAKSRWLVIGAALVVMLILGFGLGALTTRLIDSEPEQTTPGAGSVEVGFAQDMSVHHLQAVTMAGWARDHTTDPAIKTLAFDIERTQTGQVGRMKGWLGLWGQPEQATGAYMTWMTEPSGHGGHGGADMKPSNGAPMPGMATSAELAKLRSLTGKEMDVFFLQLMLRHHMGGTEMAQYGNDHTSIADVKSLTRSMLVSQGAEMDLMKSLLQERGASPLPA
ncbi:DUF305 domain-containing protein [Amycolatopsis azurea]|uniref:DUF305 domain-containing protein n=1 Tax=Amycolatopsis azurea DSM 43854 TaxID=1238180 RepID=M2QCC0_9PSEU|nr:DUF305 domain-containing protein [Amycolatopsis azurea]EMD29685.1 hypothetical protein C791_3044 [Amycolatopsis azurea DSM 43854]OOC07590.1 DUF305 domain-containing protein [Amycolatopsis azurea DSM 43854]